MNRLINDEDRMVIGVREWAIEIAIDKEKGSGVMNYEAEKIVEYAGKLEKFVLRGIEETKEEQLARLAKETKD